MDFYEILNIHKTATQEEIKHAYRRKAKETHPDREGGNKEAFQKVKQAYDTLSDEEKRKFYDDFGVVSQQKTSREEALSLVSTIFTELCGIGHIENPLKACEEEIFTKIREVKGQKSLFLNTRKRLLRVKKKLKFNGIGEDFLYASVRWQRAGNDQNYIKAKRALKILNICLDILKDYEYEKDLYLS